MATVECKNVSIRYITGDLKSIGLKEYIMRRATGKYHIEVFWADKDITFSLEEGDMLGIIGANGAGKSTLLKAITGIMLPSKGSVKTKGTIAALLELASGFDNDMTVRENTYLRGALLGYTQDFLDSKYDEIIRFAELEEFQDFYFKQLSSGMKSRLAFSIACLVDPDILILDEVLSVGDGGFQKKSGDKMKEIIARGITGILVSHSVSQIREICNKILWIDHGNQIAFSDEVDLYCDAYEQFLYTKKLPKDRNDIETLSHGFQLRMQEQKAAKQKKEIEKIEKMIEKGDSLTVTKAALNVLKKHNPEALNKQYLEENGLL